MSTADFHSTVHPVWCDPRMCDDYIQSVQTDITQSARDDAPTLGLFSESVGTTAASGPASNCG